MTNAEHLSEFEADCRYDRKEKVLLSATFLNSHVMVLPFQAEVLSYCCNFSAACLAAYTGMLPVRNTAATTGGWKKSFFCQCGGAGVKTFEVRFRRRCVNIQIHTGAWRRRELLLASCGEAKR